VALKEEIKLLREKRKIEGEIKALKAEGVKLDDQGLAKLKALEDRKKRIAKIESKAAADREKSEFKFLGIASKVSALQDEIGKKQQVWTKTGTKSVFKFATSFKLAASNMQPMIRGGNAMTDTFSSIALLMDDISQSSELAENYLGGGSKEMAATTSVLKSHVGMYEEWASGQNEGGQAFSKESMARGQEMLPKMIKMSGIFDSAITQIGEGLTDINDLQSQNLGITNDLAMQYGKLGTDGYTVSVDKAQELYDLAIKQNILTQREIKSGKIKLKNLKAELATMNPADALYDSMVTSIQQMEDDMVEMNNQADTLVKTGKQNLANSDRMRQMNNQIGASMKYILGPHEKLKSIMESLPFGSMISSFVDLEGLGMSFGDTVQKNLVGAFSEPTVALEEYTTKTGKIAERYRDLSTGQLVSKDDDSVLTLNDMDGALDNITTGAMDYTEKLASGMKVATKGAWQFVTAALANPYVAVAAAIALIGVLLYKAMSYAEAMRQEFGVTRGEAFEIQASVDATAMNFKMLGVSAEDVGTMAQGIADSMGGVSNITQENLSTMAELQGLYGMSADSIAPAMTAMKALGAESNAAASAQLAQIGHMAQMEGVAPAKVFEDITANMGTFSRFGKEGGKNLAKASIMARKLGTSLESMAATSDALLDFESNINDQMEASMLTGRMINMDKARELALKGDIAGQEREILKQIGTQAEFEAMNVVQRDALAKATGKSTEDLASMLANQANLNAMTSEERAEKERMQRADEKTNEGMKSMGSMLGDLFKQAMEPLKQLMIALGPTLGAILKVLAVTLKVAWAPLKVVFAILNPIIKLLGWMLDLIITIGGAIMKVLVFPFQLLWEGIKAAFGLLMNVVKAPFNFIIAGVNAMINGLNALSITVPDWVPLIGGKQFGFNLPPVPSLETKAGGPGHNVTQTGVAQVHKGESVGTFDMTRVEGKLDQVIDLLGQSGPIAIGVGGVKSNTKSISDQIV
jgi:hypothetical protein